MEGKSASRIFKHVQREAVVALSMALDMTPFEEGAKGLSLTEVVRSCLQCGILVFKGSRKIVHVTPAAASMIGLPIDKLMDKTPAILPRPLQTLIKQALRSRKDITNRKVQLPSGTRGLIPVAVNVTVSRLKRQKVHELVVVLNELTPLKKLELDVRRLDRLASIGIFSAGMTHEIKNAFVAVKTFVDLLLQENQSAELATIVKREISRIDSLVSQVLKFAGPAKPTFSSVRLHETLDHALRLVQHQLDRKKITLSREFKASLDRLQGDHYQLEQAFFNLLFNAVEATGPNGRLSVVTEYARSHGRNASSVTPSQLRVTIRDTGSGIDPANLGRIFEPFFTTKPNGTGLGLPIARRIIHEHRGTVDVDSSLNKGTTFDIVFPASE